MVKQLSHSKFIAIVMAITLILNTLTPMTVVFAADETVKYNKDGIASAKIINELRPEENDLIDKQGVIKSISNGDNENLITFDLSSLATSDLFLGLEYKFYLSNDENIKILNEQMSEINLQLGYAEFFKEANKPYKFYVQRNDEEPIEYTAIVKTKDYNPNLEIESTENIKVYTFELGTTKEAILKELPTEISLNLNNKTTRKVAVSWDFTNFKVNEAGDYTLTGMYELPEGVTGEKKPVEAKVIIKGDSEAVKQLTELINKAKTIQADDYTKESYQHLNKAIANGEVALQSNDILELNTAIKDLQLAIDSLILVTGEFEFNSQTGTITKYLGNQTNVVIPKEINDVKVKEIGKLAFGTTQLSGKNIDSVTIPDSVEVIGERAFYRAGLNKVTLPSNLKEIGEEAFKFNHLITIDIPNDLKVINASAFESNKLVSVSLPNKLTIIKARAFKNNAIERIQLPNELTEIGVNAFATNKINELKIPNKLNKIQGFADNDLTDITIPKTVTEIGKSAFSDNKLDNVTIPDSITKIGDQAFYNTQLTSVSIGQSVEEIGKEAFRDNKLKEVKIPNATKLIKEAAFVKNHIARNKILIDNYKSEIILEDRAFEGYNPIFLRDVKENLTFKKFDIITTNNGEFIASGTINNQIIYFDNNMSPQIIEVIKSNKASFKMIIDENINLSINGEIQDKKEVIHTIDLTKNDVIELEQFGVTKKFTVNTESILVNKSELESKLTTANELLMLSVLTDESESELKNLVKNAEQVFNKASTQEEVNKVNSDLTAGLTSAKAVFEVNLEGQITKYTGKKSELVIPKTWKGVTLVQINENVFSNTELKKVVLPETIKVIKKNAFMNSQLEHVEFTVNPIDNIMQKYNYLELNATKKIIIEENAFKNNSLSQLSLPYYVMEVGKQAFFGNKLSPFSVEIDNYQSKVTIGEQAFGDIYPTFLRTHINQVDKSYLIELIEQKESLTQSKYTKESFDKYKKAHEEAEVVLEKSSSEEEVAAAILNLSSALKSLKAVGTVTKNDLELLVSQLDAMDKRDFKYDASKLESIIVEATQYLANDQENQELLEMLFGDLNEIYQSFETPSELFEYKVLNNHEVEITYYKGMSTSLFIPREINGRQVTSIGEAAFKNKGLAKVEIPSTVNKIANEAFNNNVLVNIELPESLKELGVEAFKKNNLKNVEIPKRLKVIPNEAFSDNSNLNKIVLNEGLVEIGKLAFSNGKIETIEFPNSLEKIGALAFSLNRLTTIQLGKNIKEIGDQAFLNNKITEGQATINNIKGNVLEGATVIGNNGIDSKEIVELKYIGEETINVTVDPIENLEVPYGTTIETLLSMLPKEIELNINKSVKEKSVNKTMVDVTWTGHFKSEVPANYPFIASFDLPEGVIAKKPDVELIVTVLDKEIDYTALEQALINAEKVNNNPKATVQEVEDAIFELDQALEEYKPEKDLQKLETLLEKAKAINLENKTEETISILKEAVKQAESIIINEYATQDEVDAAVKVLEKAIAGLKDKPVI